MDYQEIRRNFARLPDMQLQVAGKGILKPHQDKLIA